MSLSDTTVPLMTKFRKKEESAQIGVGCDNVTLLRRQEEGCVITTTVTGSSFVGIVGYTTITPRIVELRFIKKEIQAL